MNGKVIQECQDNGYSLVRGFINGAELGRIQEEIRQLALAFYSQMNVKVKEAPLAEVDRLLVDILHQRPDWQSILYQRLQQIPWVLAATTLPQVQSLARQLLNTEAIGIWPRVQVRLDLLDDKNNHIKWHHDYLYNRGTQDSFTYWIPLVDIDKSMGLLQIAEASHINADSFNFERTGDSSKFDYNLSDEQVERLKIEIPDHYKAGDLAIFHSKTIHSGALNTNPDRARLTLLFRLQNLHTIENLNS